MNAFHGNPQLKQRLEERARMIARQFNAGLAELQEGQYAWQVRQHIMPLIASVSLSEGSDAERAVANATYGADMGIPAHVAWVQQGLFEDLHENVSPGWPLRFAKAVALNADLSTLWRDLALYVLADPKIGLALYVQTGPQSIAVHDIIRLFEEDSQDGDAWKAAAQAASRAASAAPGGHGTEAKECLANVGGAATRAAAQFAYAFSDPRNALEAIKTAGWPLRHLAEYEYYATGYKFNTPADERGMVNVGAALWDMSRNARLRDEASHTGEENRWARYQLFSDKLITLIKKRSPRGPSIFGRVFSSRLFGIN